LFLLKTELMILAPGWTTVIEIAPSDPVSFPAKMLLSMVP